MSESRLLHSYDAFIVIFGVTGDLARRKLLPALFRLWTSGVLSKASIIVGWGRRSWTDVEFRGEVMKALGRTADGTGFRERLRYVRGDFSDPHSFAASVRDVEKIQTLSRVPLPSCIFHIATLPMLYESVLTGLQELPTLHGLSPLLLIEKPIGSDSASSRRIEHAAHQAVGSDAIFRVDHYLMKQAVSHIGEIRMRNQTLDKMWNFRGVSSIGVDLFEKEALLGRGELYDSIGALRDVGQNHVLEILGSALGNVPKNGRVGSDERAEILESLRITRGANALRAQYNGFRNLEGVRDASDTETFFRLEIESSSTRWKGVPITLSAGKAVAYTRVELTARFRSTVEFTVGRKSDRKRSDEIRFIIQPDARVELCNSGLMRESEGASVCEIASYNDLGAEESTTVRDYERVYVEALSGSKELFVSARELEAAWVLTDEAQSVLKATPLVSYEIGQDPPTIGGGRN